MIFSTSSVFYGIFTAETKTVFSEFQKQEYNFLKTGIFWVIFMHAHTTIGQGTLPLAAAMQWDSPVTTAIQQLHNGNILDGAEALMPLAMNLLKIRETGRGIPLLMLLVQSLLDWSVDKSGEGLTHNDLRRFNYLCLELIETCLMFGYKPLNRAIRLYSRARRFTRYIGDIRVEILLNLLVGWWISIRYYRRRQSGESALFSQALKKAEELGDEDIISLTLDFRVIYYATQGNTHQCISSYASRSTSALPWNSVYVQVCSTVVAAAASVFGGRIPEGFSVLEARLRTAATDSYSFEYDWLRVQMANLLTVVGKYDQALEYLDSVALCINPVFQSALHVLFTRTLALYHLRTGHVVASYAVFKSGVGAPSHRNVRCTYYGYPWFFELLYAYQEHGFPPVAGYSLEQELDRAIRASNVNLRGVALRYKAVLARKKGLPLSVALRYVQQSFETLQQIDNQLELAHTRLEFACVFQLMGDSVQSMTHKQIGQQMLASTEATSGAMTCLAPHDVAGLTGLAKGMGTRISPNTTVTEAGAHSVASKQDGVPVFVYDTLGAVQEVVRQAAKTDVPVLLLGETGVGKEVLARHIHQLSGRKGSFIPIHPASLAEHLFESELFGHEKGAFTGAIQQKIGMVELAHEGTLFIDELGDIPLSLQVKLLRVLQEHVFFRVGGTRQLRSDFRVISATHRNMREHVAQGLFREDLYYRVSVIPITLPPLRHNTGHIAYLAQQFLVYYAARHQKKIPAISPSLMEALKHYPWPGNIRELKSAVERAVILYNGHELDILPHTGHIPQAKEADSVQLPDMFSTLPTMDVLQRAYVQYVLDKTNNRVCGDGGAEEILGMKRSTLYAKIKEYGITLK